MLSITSKTLLLFSFISIVSISNGQTPWKNWDGASIDLSFAKKMDVSFNHLRTYDVPGFQNNYNQTGANLGYDFTKNLSGKAGVTFTHFPANGITTSRVWLRGTYKLPIGETLNWFNGLQGEIHSANETRYSYRLIYQTRLATRHRVSFLKITPSVSYWLYYNIGGNAIQYYDESGSPLVQQTADGLHRGRFTINMNSKINQNISLNLYYLNQHEFNLAGHDVNVVNPTTGKVSRPFNNYQVAGVSLAFSFDLYKKKSKNHHAGKTIS